MDISASTSSNSGSNYCGSSSRSAVILWNVHITVPYYMPCVDHLPATSQIKIPFSMIMCALNLKYCMHSTLMIKLLEPASHVMTCGTVCTYSVWWWERLRLFKNVHTPPWDKSSKALRIRLWLLDVKRQAHDVTIYLITRRLYRSQKF